MTCLSSPTLDHQTHLPALPLCHNVHVVELWWHGRDQLRLLHAPSRAQGARPGCSGGWAIPAPQAPSPLGSSTSWLGLRAGVRPSMRHVRVAAPVKSKGVLTHGCGCV